MILDLLRPEDVGLSSEGLRRIDKLVQGYIDTGQLAGAVTLVARRGRIAHAKVMGRKDVATDEPLQLDTIFRVFSMTKPVTATAMMILHDQGLWRPEDPIAKHLPELAHARVFSGRTPDGRLEFTHPDHLPTVGELMTHTAGFGYGLVRLETNDPIELMYGQARVWDAPDLQEMIARLAKLPLAHQPGTKWRYSISMDVQGAMIERLSGQPLATFMRDRIFEPLRMRDTGFHTPPEKASRLATLYLKTDTSELVRLANPLLPDCDREPAFASGGAGLVSTAHDFARYAQMLLNGGELDGSRIVSRDAVRRQMTDHLPEEILRLRPVLAHLELRPGLGFGYNAAVVSDPKRAGLPVGRGTYQWDGAAGTWFWVDPENELLFVGLVQALSLPALPLLRTTQTMMGAALLD
jgi:CubicO group peptidase (beta-lactamase class C family)